MNILSAQVHYACSNGIPVTGGGELTVGEPFGLLRQCTVQDLLEMVQR